ncbi:hypothetical protein HHK36_020655 [Tetracentron sinense]|uniref:Aquaporin NIP7-1 n=1 Tax=Tetracentron sinense TaxID=13715 RepID=A0A834Z067_TETSI|nr:hypothetical protein HHK36_020655 [Tetracentron sinense]
MRSLTMKNLLEEPSPSDYSTNGSTSEEFRGDHEMGVHKMSKNGDDPMEDSTVRCFPCRVDLNSIRMVFAEIVGTFILMFCVSGIIASTQLMRGEVGLSEYAATAGLTIIVVIFSIGHISGAHVNPSVTIAFATFGQFPWSKVPFYISAQMVGSVLATYVGKSVYGIHSDLLITRPLHGLTSAFWVELIAAFFIMFLAASLLSEAHTVAHLSGFVIGIAIALAVLITGPVSGGSLNPARSFGPAIVSWKFDELWLYLVAPTVGALAGALLFRVLRLQRRPCSSPSLPSTSLLVK